MGKIEIGFLLRPAVVSANVGLLVLDLHLIDDVALFVHKYRSGALRSHIVGKNQRLTHIILPIFIKA